MQNKNTFTEKSTSSWKNRQTIPVIFKLCKSIAKEETFSIFSKADIITLPARFGTEKEKPDQKPKNIDGAKIL